MTASERRRIAKELDQAGRRQHEIAAHLGVAQSTVSWLLRSEDPQPQSAYEKEIRKIQRLAKDKGLLLAALSAMTTKERQAFLLRVRRELG